MSYPRVFWMVGGTLSAVLIVVAEPLPQRMAAAPAVPPERSHRLFLGADLRVRDEAGWHRIDGVEKGWFVARGEGEPLRIPMDRPGGFEFRLERTLKVSAQELDVVDLERRQAYTPQRDPGRRWVSNQSMALNSAGQDVDAAVNQLAARLDVQAQRQAMINSLGAGVPAAVVDDLMRSPAPDIAGALGEVAVASSGAAGGRYESDYGAPGPAGRDDARAEHDALRVTGVLRSSLPLRQPYLVMLVEFTSPDDVARHRRLFAEPLRQMRAGEMQKFSVLRGGFPLGFELGHVQLHYFDGGSEVATSDSERLTRLTRDEALQFVVLDHISRHRDARKPEGPSLVLELLSPAERAAWAQQGRPCFVRITAEGRPAAVYLDASGERPLTDPEVLALVLAMGFRPAVNADGEAFESRLLLEKEATAYP